MSTRVSPSARKRLLFLVAASVISIVGILAARDSVREWWLETKSTESLSHLSEDSGDTLALYIYAQRLMDNREPESAWEPARRAADSLAAKDSSARAARILSLAAYLAARFGDEKVAESFLARAERAQSRDAQVALARGILQLRRGRPSEAVASFRRVAESEPDRVEAWTRLGTGQLEDGNPTEAVKALRNATRLSPTDAAVHADLGEALARDRQYPEAAREFTRAAELDSRNPQFLVLRATAIAQAARTDLDYLEAANALREALSRAPEDDSVRLLLGGLHMRFGRLEAARYELEAALKRQPINADGWLNLSTVGERMGIGKLSASALSRFQTLIDTETNIVALTQQTLLRPRDARRHLKLALALHHVGRSRDAYRELTRAADIDPNDPEVTRLLAAANATMPDQALRR